MNRSRVAAGFTLLELIVAAGILALIAVFSWRGLDALIREREAIAASQDTIDRLQRSFARIERDALLAGDAQLDERSLRLVAAGGGDDAAAPAVEYRVVDGAFTRSIDGGGTPAILLDGVAGVSIEVWLPAPRGGAWVRAKGAASPLPRPAAPAATPAAGASPPNANGTSSPAQPAPGTALATTGAGGTAAPNGAAGAAPGQGGPAAPPAIAAATGIRLTIARADGTSVTRSFVVGGG